MPSLAAWLTRTFDRIPVKGPMVVVVAIVGAALALTLGQGSGTGCKLVEALALTKHGHPRHPLYARGDVEPVPYWFPRARA